MDEDDADYMQGSDEEVSGVGYSTRDSRFIGPIGLWL